MVPERINAPLPALVKLDKLLKIPDNSALESAVLTVKPKPPPLILPPALTLPVVLVKATVAPSRILSVL